MSQILNAEPSKTQIVLGSAAAAVTVAVFAVPALALFLVAFVCNLPKALEDHDDAQKHHKNRQDFQ